MRRTIFAAVGLGLIAAAPAGADPSPLATPAFRVPASGSGWIDFDAGEGGQIIIPVTLNGEPVRALLDTGVPQLLVSKAFADRHHLPLTPWGKPTSFGGPTEYYTTPGITFEIGAVRTSKAGAAAVTDLSNLSTTAIGQFDVVIGIYMLGDVEWQIDQDRHRFRLLPSGTLPITNGVPVHKTSANQRLVTDITVNGTPIAQTMLDTGSDDAISLSPAVASHVGMHAVTDFQAIGAGGMVVQPLARLESFAIGKQVLGDVYATTGPDWFPGEDIRAVIGMRVLSRYNLTVDAPAGVMELSPRTTPMPPPAKSTSGVQGNYSNGRLQVSHVMKNSPAAAGGIKDGDAICAINGKPMSQQLVDQHWGRAAPGTRYVVTLCDGTMRKITLRNFY